MNKLLTVNEYKRGQTFIGQIVFNISTDCDSKTKQSTTNEYYFQQITGKIDEFAQFISNTTYDLKQFLSSKGVDVQKCYKYSTVRLGLPLSMKIKPVVEDIIDDNVHESCYFEQPTDQLVQVQFSESENEVTQMIYSQPYQLFNLKQGKLIQLQQLSFQIEMNKGKIDYKDQQICYKAGEKYIIETDKIFADYRSECKENIEKEVYCVDNSDTEHANGYAVISSSEDIKYINPIFYVSFKGSDAQNNKLSSEKDSFAYLQGFIKGKLNDINAEYFQNIQDHINKIN